MENRPPIPPFTLETAIEKVSQQVYWVHRDGQLMVSTLSGSAWTTIKVDSTQLTEVFPQSPPTLAYDNKTHTGASRVINIYWQGIEGKIWETSSVANKNEFTVRAITPPIDAQSNISAIFFTNINSGRNEMLIFWRGTDSELFYAKSILSEDGKFVTGPFQIFHSRAANVGTRPMPIVSTKLSDPLLIYWGSTAGHLTSIKYNGSLSGMYSAPLPE